MLRHIKVNNFLLVYSPYKTKDVYFPRDEKNEISCIKLSLKSKFN